MSVSSFMKKIIDKALDDKFGDQPNRTDFTVTTDDKRNNNNVAEIKFKFSKPVDVDTMNKAGRSVLKYVMDGLDTRQLGIVDTILAQYGLRNKIGKKRTTGKVNIHFGDFAEEGFGAAIQTTSGKLMSQTNLRSLIEIAAKEYLIKNMKRPGAPLKYRTGRFANSLRVTSALIAQQSVETKAGKPSLSIFYKYMLYPYATFDPQKSNRPAMYNNPSFGARNPQKLIGEAIAMAARDIIHKRYRINVRESAT